LRRVRLVSCFGAEISGEVETVHGPVGRGLSNGIPPLTVTFAGSRIPIRLLPPRLLGRPRARRGEALVVASDASPLDGGPSPSLSAAVAAGAYVLARRVVLLGATAVPLVRLREAAAAPTPVDFVKG
jgi:hypothetical protein